jgi:hypothetical protein
MDVGGDAGLQHWGHVLTSAHASRTCMSWHTYLQFLWWVIGLVLQPDSDTPPRLIAWILYRNDKHTLPIYFELPLNFGQRLRYLQPAQLGILTQK